MNLEWIILILLFGILYITEYKPTYSLIYFVGIVITSAIQLSYWNCEYFSYILIIIYVSALTIIFGFVIMLDKTYLIKTYNIKIKIFYIFLAFIALLLSFIFNFIPLNINLYNYLINDIPLILNNYFVLPYEYENKGLNNLFNINNNLLTKLGFLLYCDISLILKLLIITTILLLALIGVVFILK